VKRLAAALRTRIALRQKRAKTALDPKQRYAPTLNITACRWKSNIATASASQSSSSSAISALDALLLRVDAEFLFALQGQVRKTHAFAFIDHLEFISDEFNGSDADKAIASVLWRMPSGHYNTDLGWSLNDFNNEYLDTLNGQTTLILVGDGRNNYNDPRIDIFSTMSAVRRGRFG